jgi:hypothetical protein
VLCVGCTQAGEILHQALEVLSAKLSNLEAAVSEVGTAQPIDMHNM